MSKIKDQLLSNRNGLSFKVEGRSTNLRVWIDPNKLIYFARLDKFQAYSSPLNEKSIDYLEIPNKYIKMIVEKFKFGCKITQKQLDDLCSILSNLKERECRIW